MPSGKRTWTTFAESWLKQMKSDHCFVLIVNEKQMKHGRSCNSQMWLISFENVTLGLHPHVTFSTWCLLYLNVALTTVHHLYNDEHHVTASWPISAAAHSWSYDSIERWTCHGWRTSRDLHCNDARSRDCVSFQVSLTDCSLACRVLQQCL